MRPAFCDVPASPGVDIPHAPCSRGLCLLLSLRASPCLCFYVSSCASKCKTPETTCQSPSHLAASRALFIPARQTWSSEFKVTGVISAPSSSLLRGGRVGGIQEEQLHIWGWHPPLKGSMTWQRRTWDGAYQAAPLLSFRQI